MEQRTPEWYRIRCGRITGTRFARAMARRDSRTYQSLVDQLVRERVSGNTIEIAQTPAMLWGVQHEGVARDWYVRTRRHVVTQVGFVKHPLLDYVGVSPDGLVGSVGMIEIKCPQLPQYVRVRSRGGVPSQYRWQLQGQLWVCGRDWVDFVCFYPPDLGLVIRVAPNRDDAAALEARCREIESDVRKRVAQVQRRLSQAADAPIAANPATSLRMRAETAGRARVRLLSGWYWLIAAVVLVWIWLAR